MILAIYAKHDANITLFNDDGIVLFLELEKLTQNRYQSFSPTRVEFMEEFQGWVSPYLKGQTIEKVYYNWLENEQLDALNDLFPSVTEFIPVTHHLCHAWSVYNFTTPQKGDLIISYDGRGDLGESFVVYGYQNGNLSLKKCLKLRLGACYRMLGTLSPEIDAIRTFEFGINLSVPGKAMALAGFGTNRPEWSIPIRRFYEDFMNFPNPKDNAEILLQEINFVDIPIEKAAARDVLATSQKVFEDLVFEQINEYFNEGWVERVLVTGGCGLNVTVNTIIEEATGKAVFVPPCPNDSGISLGLYRFANKNAPLLSPFEGLPFLKSPEFEMPTNIIERVITKDEIASMLYEGKIIGLILGNCEIGPRALGHRSLLANPFLTGMRSRVNNLKGREFFRPVAPMVIEEEFHKYFQTNKFYPYMSHAPGVREEYKTLFNEVTHVDGSARAQSVSSDDPDVYSILVSFAKLSGHPILMNTSLNKKGRPLVNDIQNAFELLSQTGLDALVIESKLYEKSKP